MLPWEAVPPVSKPLEPVDGLVGAPDDPRTLFLFTLIWLGFYPFWYFYADAVLFEDRWDATLVLVAPIFLSP